MTYTEEQYTALEEKAVNHILARDNKIEQQSDHIKELETALREIISQADPEGVFLSPDANEGLLVDIQDIAKQALEGGDA